MLTWHYMRLIVYLTIGAIGIVGNALAVTVLHLKMKRNNPNFMLKAVCVNGIIMMLLLISMAFSQYFLEDKTPKSVLLVFMLHCSSRFTAGWLLAFISCARTFAFLWPSHTENVWSNLRVYGAVIAIPLAGCIVQIPMANNIIFEIYNEKYFVLWSMFNVLCVDVIPMVLLMLSLIPMAGKIKVLAYQECSNSPGGIIEGVRVINKVLIALAISYTFCHVPFSANSLRHLIQGFMTGDKYVETCWNKVLNLISYGFITMNIAFQIGIFAALNKEFNSGLKEILKKS